MDLLLVVVSGLFDLVVIVLLDFLLAWGSNSKFGVFEALFDLIIVERLLNSEGFAKDCYNASDEVEAHLVIGIEFDHVGGSLGGRPEDSSVIVLEVSWEAVEELGDLIIEVILVELSRHIHKALEISLWPSSRKFVEEIEFVFNTTSHVAGLLELVIDKALRVFDKVGKVKGAIAEEAMEDISCPLDGMVEVVGVISEGAHRDGFLSWVLRVRIALGLEWDDHLGVALGTKGTRLNEVLVVKHALGIDVLSGLDVVNGSENAVNVVPENVGENVLCVFSDSVLHGYGIDVLVDGLGNAAGYFGLAL